MPTLLREPDSRTATDRLLALLHGEGDGGGGGVRAWWAFAVGTTARSLAQVGAHPRAAVEVVALHAGLGALAGRRGPSWGRWWVATSAAMCLTHLGMLEGRASLGVPTVLTLVRGNLPALEHRLGPAGLALALATDAVDGRLARATGAVSRFGAAADFLADTGFWMHRALTGGASRRVQVATVGTWLAPVAAVAATSMARGRMVDVPRRWWFRPAGALQVLLAVREVRGRRAVRASTT